MLKHMLSANNVVGTDRSMVGNGGMLHHTANGPRTLPGSLSHSYMGGGQTMGAGHQPRVMTNHNHTLNVSTLSTSKHSLGGNSSSVSPLGGIAVPSPSQSAPTNKIANGGLHISRPNGVAAQPAAQPPSLIPANVSRFMDKSKEAGVKEMLTSLGLLCLVSLLLALLSLIFLLKISPVTTAEVRELLRSEQLTVISPDEYVIVYEVTLALCALSLSLNLCCLLVCAVQFLFAVKLVRDSPGGER